MQHPPQRSWRPFALGLGSFLLIVLAFLAVGHFANAAITIENVGGSLGLGAADLKQTIVNILKWALGLLGLVAVMVMLYGGFVWLTSGGDEKKIEKAKRILLNGAIGLVIILVSWAIVLFIQRFITGATQTGAQTGQCIVNDPMTWPTCTLCDDNGDGIPNNNIGTLYADPSPLCIGTNSTSYYGIRFDPAHKATDVRLCQAVSGAFGGLNAGRNNTDISSVLAVAVCTGGNCNTSTPITGTMYTNGNIATFEHATDFSKDSTYTVDVTGVRSKPDLVSALLPIPPDGWTFNTGSTSDINPPSVLRTAPAQAAQLACLSPVIEVQFSETMFPPSIYNTQNLTIVASDGGSVPGIAGINMPRFDVMQVTLDAPLRKLTTYTITLSADNSADSTKGYRDTCSNALDCGNAAFGTCTSDTTANGNPADNFKWQFSTKDTDTLDCTPNIETVDTVAYHGNTATRLPLRITGTNFGLFPTVNFPGNVVADTNAGAGSLCFANTNLPQQSGSPACIDPNDSTNNTDVSLQPMVPTGPLFYSPTGANSGPVSVSLGGKTSAPSQTSVQIGSPHVNWISPREGKAGRYVTIGGSGFGSSGQVSFRTTSGESIPAVAPSCNPNPWSDTQILIQVPTGFNIGDISYVQVDSDKFSDVRGVSNLARFDFKDVDGPSLCSINPTSNNDGTAGLTAGGRGFGTTPSDVKIYYGIYTGTQPTGLTDIQLTTQPSGRLPNGKYQFTVGVGGKLSNSLEYKIPQDDAPEVVQDASCNPSTGVMPSPNPIPNATNICPNVYMEVRFNQPMNVADLNNVANVQVSRCNSTDTFDCSSPTNVLVSSINPGSTSVRYGVGSNLVQNTWYQVTLRGANIHSANPPPSGVALGADFSWHFRVRNDPANCAADAVVVNPVSIGPLYTTQQANFHASATNAQCALLRNIPGNFTWSVTANPALVALAAPTTIPVGATPADNDDVATVQGGTMDGTSTITASFSGKSGSGNLIVQRNYCDTDADCSGRQNDGNTYSCTGSMCNVPTHECQPWIKELQSGTDIGQSVAGPAGNLISVRGCFFGSTKGTGNVTFTGADGTAHNGNDICPASWINDEVRMQAMPLTAPDGEIYAVNLIAGNTLASTTTGRFTISPMCDTNLAGQTTSVPDGGVPIVCGVTPPTGREGNPISYNGDRFVTGSSRAFFTQANDPVDQLQLFDTTTSVSSATSAAAHVQPDTGIPTPATTARTTIGVQQGANYCIATPVDYAISCNQPSECSTGCCQRNICKATANCTNGFVTRVDNPTGTCRNTQFSIIIAAGKTVIPSSVNASTIQLKNGTTSIAAALELVGQTITVRPTAPLGDGTYTVVLLGGAAGIQATDGTFLPPLGFTSAPFIVDTSFRICTIASVRILSAATGLPINSDLFTCTGNTCTGDTHGAAGNQHGYTVRAYDANNAGPLTLSSTAWTQGDTGGIYGPTNVYSPATPGASCPTNETSEGYCATGQNVANGSEQLTVNVVGTGTSGTGSGAMPIRTFMCTKPWPAAGSFPFRDPDRTDAPANPSHNFTFGFCTDDLQGTSLSTPVQSPFLTGELNLSKEYFMFVEKDGARTGDTIGVRIFGSTPAGYTYDLSPKRWYKQRFGKESTGTTLEVDGYPALREGRTVYVVADNYLASGNSYPNVYVISYNDKAKSETVSTFDQVLKNLKFNDFTTALPSTLLANLRADVKRIHGMQELVFGLADYYTAHKVNPPLDTGSYIKNMSFTSWPSWQQALGSTLGITMPQDPEVLWKPSATLCGSGFDQTSCWNQVTKVMQFPSRDVIPADSHGFAYKYDSTLKRVQLYGTGSSNFYRHITTAIDVINPVINICPSSPAGNSCLGFNFGINSTNFGQMSGWRLPSALDKTAPTVNIELPSAGPIAGAVTFVMTASDETGGSGMQRVDAKIMRGTTLVASTILGAPDKDGKYRWTWNSRSALNSPPMYTLMVTATDRAGNTTSLTQNRDYTVTNPPGDSEPPVITASAQPAQWDGTTSVAVSASATDIHPDPSPPTNNTGVAKIEFYLGSSKLGEGLNATCPTCSTMYSTSVTVPATTIQGFPNGSYTYSVVAYDGFGNSSVKNATVIIDKSTGDSAPPLVAIIQPTGTVSGANTDVVANASDASGIDRVEFFIDGAFRVADFSGPYSFSWLLTGYADNSSHTIRAVAYDRYGNQATATQTVTYTIVTGPDTVRPVISDVTATLAPPPADTGATVAMDGAQLKNTVTLNATLTDNVAMLKTELRIDGVKIPLIGSAYTCSSPQVCTLAYLWDTLPETVGQHTVSITAYDTSNYATTVTQTVNVINQVIMSISSPQNDSTVKDLPAGSTCSNNPTKTCTTRRDCPLVLVGACEATGVKCTSDEACKTTANPNDYCDRPLGLCNPTPAGVPVVIDVTRTCRADQLLASVQFFLDTSSTPLPGSATCTNGRCTYTWNSKATSSNGSHTLTAKGQDSLGCKGGAKATVVVNNSVTDTTPPNITSFQFGAQTWGSSQPKYINSTNRSGNITVLAHDPPGGSGLAQITIAINGTTVQTCSLAPQSPCQYFWSPADGANYTVTVGASDVAGNAAPDQSQVVNVDTMRPTATWSLPTPGSTVTPQTAVTLTVNPVTDPTAPSGYASGIRSVLFAEDGADWATPATQSGASWSLMTDLNIGVHTYTATVTDMAGNTVTTAPITLNVVGPDTRAPWVNITVPADDGYISGTFTPQASAGDWGGSGIRDVQLFLDGVALGTPDTTSPYDGNGSTVNTTAMAQGSTHTLYAIACDKATPTNNCATSTTRTFLVNNTGGVNCGSLICSGATPSCCFGVCQSLGQTCALPSDF